MVSHEAPSGSDLAAQAWQVLESVCDPEIPVVSLRELGVLRSVTASEVDAPARVEVVITPTYSGCPAMGQMEDDVNAALKAAGIAATVRTVLAPAWTTDWISDAGKQKLKEYGIAPPGPVTLTGDQPLRFVKPGDKAGMAIPCPKCNSLRTEQLAAFGSTACKALYRCLACQEPFEHFKPI